MSGGAPGSIWAVAGLFIGIELLSQLFPQLRAALYTYFAFYDFEFEAVLRGANVTPRFLWSFVTHAFLHGGIAHLGMNTVVFLALGAHLSRAVGERMTFALFFASVVAGALAFGLIADTSWTPMVGASGGLFGLLGAMKRWEWRYVSANALPQRRFWSTILALLAINVLLSVGVGIGGGGVAWEAHLGGFVAGWIMGGALTPRRGAAIGPI